MVGVEIICAAAHGASASVTLPDC